MTASSPDTAFRAASAEPGMHGDQLCRVIVEKYPAVRVLMLTAARRLDEKVAGLELGANADPFTNAVRITISTLRAKLGEPSVIGTVTGVGYYLTQDPA